MSVYFLAWCSWQLCKHSHGPSSTWQSPLYESNTNLRETFHGQINPSMPADTAAKAVVFTNSKHRELSAGESEPPRHPIIHL